MVMDEKRYLQLNDIEAYKLAFQLSNQLWDRVILWDFFAKDTIGKQFVRAMDGISANIAEGFGRYHKKDKIKFYQYAKGSMYECLDWCEKAKKRSLLSIAEYDEIHKKLKQLPKAINALIKYTNEKLKE